MKFWSFLFLVFSFTSLFAQESEMEKHKYFGARAGITVAHPNFQKGSPPSDVATSWGSGFVGGLYLNVPLSEKVSIQPEYLFRQMNSDISDLSTTLKFAYLSLPIFLKYQLSEKFSIQAGPQFDLLIKCQSTSDDADEDLTHDTEERSIAGAFGLGYTFWKTASLNVQYIHGLNHIGMYQRNNVSEFKFESVQITLGMGF